MIAAGDLVLAASACLLGLALLALLGRAGRSRLVAAWVAMMGFAGLASFCLGRGVQLKQSAGPLYYDLPAAPAGPHKVTLSRPGLSPGYRGRLVHRKDRSFDKDLFAKLAGCNWRIPICEKLILSVRTFDRDGVFEFESEYPDLVLQYEVTPEIRPLLDEVVLELSCPAGFRETMARGLGTLKLFMALYLGGLLLAALGARSQRRQLRLQKAAAPDPSAIGPRSP